ncbi:F-box/kelch-repeat protein At3g23880-like [Silene latifolia]|uniref:F-box/kelch-repeat protein At3g23880-like n=1 Tax=Silene latifolia TaxID=37657 RepID=UPI003D789729
MATKTCFPEDLVVEILVRMPVKSVLRCKASSKHYYSLIRGQCFILRHLRLGKLNRSFLSPVLGSVHVFARGGHGKVLERTPCIVEELSNVDGHYHKIQSICGPIDGLYCVIERNNNSSRRRIALWNPATREHFILPNPEHNNYFGKKTRLEAGLIDDFCIRAFGFGHDCNENNYKVVIIYALISDMLDNKLYFYIFDVSKREWRNYEEIISLNPWNIESNVGVFVRGGCHWVCPPPLQGTVSGYTILAFDMSMERHRNIPLPESVIDEYVWSTNSIVTLNGCLALINSPGVDTKERSWCFNVWVMGEYGVNESWIFLYRVSLAPGIVGRFLGLIGDRFYVAEEEGCLVSYNLRSKNDERYDIIDNNVRHIVPYEESLVRIVES